MSPFFLKKVLSENHFTKSFREYFVIKSQIRVTQLIGDFKNIDLRRETNSERKTFLFLTEIAIPVKQITKADKIKTGSAFPM